MDTLRILGFISSELLISLSWISFILNHYFYSLDILIIVITSRLKLTRRFWIGILSLIHSECWYSSIRIMKLGHCTWLDLWITVNTWSTSDNWSWNKQRWLVSKCRWPLTRPWTIFLIGRSSKTISPDQRGIHHFIRIIIDRWILFMVNIWHVKSFMLFRALSHQYASPISAWHMILTFHLLLFLRCNIRSLGVFGLHHLIKSVTAFFLCLKQHLFLLMCLLLWHRGFWAINWNKDLIPLVLILVHSCDSICAPIKSSLAHH